MKNAVRMLKEMSVEEEVSRKEKEKGETTEPKRKANTRASQQKQTTQQMHVPQFHLKTFD